MSTSMFFLAARMAEANKRAMEKEKKKVSPNSVQEMKNLADNEAVFFKNPSAQQPAVQAQSDLQSSLLNNKRI